MDYFTIYHELREQAAKELGKPISELVAWRDYDPMEFDYLTLDRLHKLERDAQDQI